MKYLVTFFLSAFIFSCTGKNDLPSGILKPKKMQEVFWDYIRADVYTTNFIKPDSLKIPVVENLKLQSSIFKLHHVTKEEFYNSYIYYSNHRELMTAMIDSMIVKQQGLKPKIIPMTGDLQ